MKIPFYKKIASYFIPITLESSISSSLALLSIQLFQNQFLLITPRAIYSYGIRYAPFRKSFKFLKKELPYIQNFLLLGTGLGSALKILQEKHRLFPQSTLIDIDQTIINYSKKYMALNSRNNVEWICQDAMQFLVTNQTKYDLLGVDLFNDLSLPNVVKSNDFFALCRSNLSIKGIFVMNTILEDDNEIAYLQTRLKNHFSHVEFILDNRNTYYIAWV